MQQQKPRKLRQGEIKILKALELGAKTNKEIGKETGFSNQPTLLSAYLKNLQKLGLITRDIDTRKYRSEKISVEKLFFNDVSEFLNEQVAIDLKSDKKPLILAPLWFAVTDSKASEFKQILEKTLEKPESIVALVEPFNIVWRAWQNYILAQRKPKDRETITRYQELLLECYKLATKLPPIEEAADLVETCVREKLRQEFPEKQSFSEDVISIEVERQLKIMRETIDGIQQPWSLEDLERRLRIRDSWQSLQTPDQETQKRLEKILNFLEDPANKKVYESYLKSLEDAPKTLVVYPALGFKGYIKKLKELYPEKAKTLQGGVPHA
ncbi:hypothetical protein G4O51_03845 [Candidatus Bathyarchaeota archaeon A05DMB-2]|jgi:hypothetical protein|nr:hypothetical protein [Candidatus Bathyarchaeota archaeon A05DMB-2]